MKHLASAFLAVLPALMFFCTVCQAAEEDPGQLYAQSVCLTDGDSGRILYGKEENQERAMASTTKIMTCILVLENCELTEKVTASAQAADQPKVHLGVKTGQRFLLEDLLFALMLESYNDAAVMLAEHVDGSVETFAQHMNAKAAELGCEQTHFVTPNGLDGIDEGGTHHTTAADLAAIMRYCVRLSPKATEFLRITQTKQVTFSDLDNVRTYACTNHNRLFSMTDGVLSGKTGFTSEAGYCYVGAVESEGRTFILTLLGCGWPDHKNWKWEDARKLLTYAKERYHWKRIQSLGFSADVEMEDAVWRWGKQEIVCRIPAEEQKKTRYMLLADNEQIRAEYTCLTRLKAPAKAGDTVGTVRYMSGDTCIQENDVVLTKSVDAVTKDWCRRMLLQAFLFRKKEAANAGC